MTTEVETKPHLSASQLEMFARCGLQWYHRYIEKDIDPPGVAMVQGKACHKGIEVNLGHKKETGQLLQEQEVAEVARDEVNRVWAEDGISLTDEEAALGEKAVRGEAVDNAVAFAIAHHRTLAPIITPLHLERRFDLELTGYPYDLVGYIDIQEPSGIRDTKTKNTRAPSLG